MRVIWSPLGRPLTLNCGLEVPDDPNFTLQWRKNEKLIFSVFGHDKGHGAPELQGRITRSDHALGITIHAAELTDEGVYHCVLTPFSKTPTSPEFGKPTQVVINTPPKVTHPANGLVQFHLPSTSLSIECSASGSPPPEISWSKDETVISSNSSLYIRSLHEDDKGDYVCQAINSAGQDKVTISIRFAKPTKIDFGPQNKTVNEGLSIFWSCQASAFPDKIDYSWKYNGKPIKTTDVGLRAIVRDSELSISPIRPSDTGWYSCQAENGIGKPDTAKAYLQVNYRPTVLSTSMRLYTSALGRAVSLECRSDASPVVSRVLWSKNGVFLRQTNSTSLTFSRITEDDAGVYSCVAENDIGRSDPFEMHLVIAEPPQFASKPPPVVYSKIGGAISVECTGFGDPMPIQYWLRDKKRINNQNLLISSVSHADHGVYTCFVANSVATISAELMLYVQNTRPQPCVIIAVQCLDETGFFISWNPGYDSGLAQSFIVHYQSMESPDEYGSVHSDEATAQILGLTPFSRYRIVIEAKNSEGSTNSTVIEKNVCSKLEPPSRLAVENNIVSWERADGAQSYKIEYKDSKGSRDGFVELAEVLAPPYVLPSTSSIQALPTGRPLELRIRSLRKFYTPSLPSRQIEFEKIDFSPEPTFWWMGITGGLFLLLFVLLFFLARKNRICVSHSKKKKRRRSLLTASAYDRQTAPGDSYFTPPEKGLGDRRDSGNWSGSRNDPLNALLREPYSYDEFEIESSTAVDDMFREQYVFRADVDDACARATILEDLRIEKLKREFKQSQL